MLKPKKFAQNRAIGVILRENFSPVARMRLISSGLQSNNRLADTHPATGDKGCLACGCCVDACPVVREKRQYVFPFNRRTSMSLENIVGDECRRCYRCVRACPQVAKDAKEYVWGFRRVEKFVHAAMATAIFTLMCSGIFLYHYRADIPGWHASVITFFHYVAGIVLILVPFLFRKLDPDTFKHTLTRAWDWKSDAAETRAWLREFAAFLRHPVGKSLPHWKEFNPYHKFWICWLSLAIPVLAVTGVTNMLGPNVLGEGLYKVFYACHSLTALCTDLLVFTHLYFKLLRWIIRMICAMYKAWRKDGSFDYPFLFAGRRGGGN